MKLIFGIFLFFGQVTYAQDYLSLKQELSSKYHQHQLMFVSENKVQTKSWLEHVLQPLFNADSVLIYPNAYPDLIEKFKPFVANICKSPTGRKICRQILKKLANQSSENLEVQTNEILKRLHIVLGSQSSRIDGWTYNHQMILFFDLTKSTNHHLYRQLIHEMYQLIDYKNDFLAFGQEFGHRIKEQLCATQKLMQISEIRWATSALRAFQVEDIILFEMGINSKFELLQSLSCSNRITILQTYFFELNGFFQFDQHNFSPLQQQCEVVTGLTMTTTEQELALNLLIPKNAEEHYSLCEYLTEPDLEREFDKYIMFSNQGPRPRIGDP